MSVWNFIHNFVIIIIDSQAAGYGGGSRLIGGIIWYLNKL